MNKRETGQLLAYISSFDNRNFNELTAATWNELFLDYDIDECKQLVRQHFDESSEWLMPAHLKQRLRETRRARLRAIGTVPRVNEVDAGRPDAHQVMKKVANAIASGRMSPAEYGLYLVGNSSFEAVQNNPRKEVER